MVDDDDCVMLAREPAYCGKCGQPMKGYRFPRGYDRHTGEAIRVPVTVCREIAHEELDDLQSVVVLAAHRNPNHHEVWVKISNSGWSRLDR